MRRIEHNVNRTQADLLLLLSGVGGRRDMVCRTSSDVGVRESTLNDDV
jgi:hypothetical protein